MAMVQHKGANRPNRYGGTTYRTLCGRMNARCSDGMNVANADTDVTCKFCIRILERAALNPNPEAKS